jgi:hypothetical protein
LRTVGYLVDGPLEEKNATFGPGTCFPVILLAGSIFTIGKLFKLKHSLAESSNGCRENNTY